ncbi:hypothetical protein [Actinomadura flavalba]|uniref:hypothetical protein n=1 Tax=Actinomadura flavalba TaxID=1120938 RepID=UPI0003601C3D|nr:hypothetical protein [Actinomadura flavalba]
MQQAPAPPAPGRRGVRRALPRTAAGRVRALAAAVVVALAATLAVTWAAVADARDGVRVIGRDAGPQVVATGDLYFQLTDMDAQLASALLIGRAEDLGVRRADAIARYDANRARAGAALLTAARLADERSEEETARDLLSGLGRYERLASQALLLDQQDAHAAGPPSARVTAVYRQATDLMKLDLLPKAYNLTLDNGTLVRHTYEDRRSAVRAGTVAVVVTGVLLLALLVALQVFLTVRFRRLLNPALALATLLVVGLTGLSTVMLLGQAERLRTAKEDGFDSILALSRTRAISNSAYADQTRYLLDPGRADTYEQVFFSKSQSVLYLRAGNLAAYNDAVQRQSGNGRYLGFLGVEAGRQGIPGQRAALARVVVGYRAFQADDRRLRQLTGAGERGRAVAARLGEARGFAAYDASLVRLAALHQDVFDDAIRDGEDGSRYWEYGLPAAGLAVIVLVLLGVRPRLAEYR